MKFSNALAFSVLAVATLASAAATSPTAKAADAQTSDFEPRFEVSALTNGVFFFNGDGSGGYIVAGASYSILPGVQISLNLGYARFTVAGTALTSSYTTWALGGLVGPVINFPFQYDVRDAFFGSVKYGAGLVGATSDISDNSRGLIDVALGKRFQIFERLSYAPEIGMSKVIGGSGTNNALFRIVPVGLSLFF